MWRPQPISLPSSTPRGCRLPWSVPGRPTLNGLIRSAGSVGVNYCSWLMWICSARGSICRRSRSYRWPGRHNHSVCSCSNAAELSDRCRGNRRRRLLITSVTLPVTHGWSKKTVVSLSTCVTGCSPWIVRIGDPDRRRTTLFRPVPV